MKTKQTIKPYKTDSKRLDKRERKAQAELRKYRQCGKKELWQSQA